MLLVHYNFFSLQFLVEHGSNIVGVCPCLTSTRGIQCDYINEQYRLKCSKSNEYFLDTWLCGNYPDDIWTHFNSWTPRTNNGCEGYNSRLSRRVVISHPNIYELITILKQEHDNKSAFLVQLEDGHCPQKKRKLDRFVDQRIRQCGLSSMLYVIWIIMKDYLFNCGDVLWSDFE